MKKTSYLIQCLKERDSFLFESISNFLEIHFPNISTELLSKKIFSKKKEGFVLELFKEIHASDALLFSQLEAFFLKEKELTCEIFGDWASDVQTSKESYIELINVIESNFERLPIDVLPALFQQVTTLLFLDGLLQENSNRLNSLYKKIINRLGRVAIKERKNKERKVYIFVSEIIWGRAHAPTLIVKNWVEILAPVFGTINVVVSPTPSYYLPLEKRFIFNNWCPKDGDLNVRFLEVSPTLSNTNLEKVLTNFISEHDILLSVGSDNFIFDRIEMKNKFLWPTCQYKFLHSADYVFSFNNQDMLSQKNIYGHQVKFLPVSTGGFIDLSEDDAILPLDRFKRKTDFNSVNLVAIGNRLMLEMDQKFFQIIESISKNYKVKLTCVGIESFCFPEIKNVSFECVGFQNNLESYVRESDFDFFINPRRSGGGFGAVVSLVSGIPTLTLPYGDIFQIMKNFYYMNDEKDFSVFINSFMTDPSFREAINNLHLAMKEISENVNNDPSFLPLNRMLNALEI